MLTVPAYIKAASIQDTMIRYRWDDWNVEQAYEPLDEELYARMQGISQRANLAFAIGVGEWVVYRFGALCDNRLPLQYLEAAWAQQIHWRYGAFSWEDYGQDQWIGPILGPIAVAMKCVMFAIGETKDDGDPYLMATWIAGLAQYTMTNPAPFWQWRDRILKRLEKLYVLNLEEKLGEVVPREALDPDYDFQLEQADLLINKFLAPLDFNTNPFLNSPPAMLGARFEGKPYAFDIEKDRKDRFEW